MRVLVFSLVVLCLLCVVSMLVFMRLAFLMLLIILCLLFRSLLSLLFGRFVIPTCVFRMLFLTLGFISLLCLNLLMRWALQLQRNDLFGDRALLLKGLKLILVLFERGLGFFKGLLHL